MDAKVYSQKTHGGESGPAVDAKTHEWEAVRVTTGERKVFRRYEDATAWINEAEVGVFGFETAAITGTRSEVRLA